MNSEPIQATITSYCDLGLIDGEWEIVFDGQTLTVDEFNALPESD